MQQLKPTTRRVTLALLCLCALPAFAQTVQRIDHVEPPSWWAGMHNRNLQLLVHGPQIAKLTPTIKARGIKLKDVHRTDNPNYLFLDLLLSANLKAGNVDIIFSNKSGEVARHSYPIKQRAEGSAAREGFSGKDVIYLVTPDRFANANLENDAVAGLSEGPNRSEDYGRHGGDLDGVIARVDYIADMGFTQLWLNPVMQNNQAQWSYHGYAITDFYQVDARFGSNEQFQDLARKAGARGVGLIKDVILNHAGSEHWWMKDMPSADWINNNGQFVPTTHHRETLRDPHAVAEDVTAFTDGWFVESMPDLNQRNPFMTNYLIQNTIWWIEYAGLSGLRVDTWPYSDKAFLIDYAERVLREYPKLNIVGEEWTSNPAIIAYWQRGNINADGYESKLPSLFDFPLQEKLTRALTEQEDWGSGLVELYRVLANDIVYPDPDQLVVFADNHDMSRIFTQLGHDESLMRMALGFILTTRGIPQIYYGTEILYDNPLSTSHGVIRRDFAGGWANDSADAVSGEGLSDAQLAMQSYLRTLLNWRQSASAVHSGKLTHYAPKDGVYVYFRHNADQRVMIIMNKNDTQTELALARFQTMLAQVTHARDVVTEETFVVGSQLTLKPRSIRILSLSAKP